MDRLGSRVCRIFGGYHRRGSIVSEQPFNRVTVSSSARSRRSKLVVLLAYVLSAFILGWSFWISFQAVRSGDTGLRIDPIDLSERVESRRNRAEDVRSEAFARDAILMQNIREKRVARTSNKPTSDESKKWLIRRVNKVRRTIQELGDPEQGTVEWEYKQYLIRSLEDASI